MKIIEKDILTVESGIIVQSVNCQGVMGKGIAKLIRDKWPIVYDKYIKKFDTRKNSRFELLGEVNVVKVSSSLYVCNIFCQLEYGYNTRFTDYCAIKESLKDLNNRLIRHHKTEIPIYFPYQMGCINGGGDWNIVSKMIEYYFPNAIICKLPK